MHKLFFTYINLKAESFVNFPRMFSINRFLKSKSSKSVRLSYSWFSFVMIDSCDTSFDLIEDAHLGFLIFDIKTFNIIGGWKPELFRLYFSVRGILFALFVLISYL